MVAVNHFNSHNILVNIIILSEIIEIIFNLKNCISQIILIMLNLILKLN